MNNTLNIKDIITATMVLMAVINILGSIPLIIQIRKRYGNIYPAKTAMVSGGIIIGFLFLGESILRFIGIDINSFAVAGALVILILGFEMVLNLQIFKDDDEDAQRAASIVPLAFPMIAGAGSMTTAISLRAEFSVWNIVIAVVINMLWVYIVLHSTARIEKLLGQVGMAILKKVFGIILVSIAVKLFSANASQLF